MCRIFGGTHCTTSSVSPAPSNAGSREKNGGDRSGGENPDGSAPSLADLQDQADRAQHALDGANDGSDIEQKIIDLLKDFVGITDVEECITKGDIASCLWAVFDVASLFFAALKIAKFAKAVKDAVKLWKDFSRARKVLSGLKTSAKTARDRLKRVAERCGVTVYGASMTTGRRIVPAADEMRPIEPVKIGDHRLAHDTATARPRPERAITPTRSHGYGQLVGANVAADPSAPASTPIAAPSKPAGRPLLLAHNARSCGPEWEKVSGMLRDASKGKGNFGIGSGTRAEADAAGKAWVGSDYRVASDGKTLVSKDGLRQYRPPSNKPKLGKTQANFEQRYKPDGQWQGNGHLDITD